MKTIITMGVLKVILLALFITGCDSTVNSNKEDEILQITYEIPYFETKYRGHLTKNQRKVLKGAKEVLDLKARYDTTMNFRPVNYLHGFGYKGDEVYPNGDIDPTIGVCTDVIVRALRYGGVTDLQREINEDINNNPGPYPLERWGTRSANKFIDHRRVPNQHTWFKYNWTNLNFYDFQPGDVVVWDFDKDDAGDHIGIISDKLAAGIRPLLIHNSPKVGHTSETDDLRIEDMIGHYRIKD